MSPLRLKRLSVIVILIALTTVAVSLILYALRQNINLFYTPTQIEKGEAPKHHSFRVGGLVVTGSLSRDQDLGVKFAITDGHQSIWVHYNGILPDLFREGQGIVALGKLNADDIFTATQVLAKHDEKYTPPEVSEALKNSEKISPQSTFVNGDFTKKIKEDFSK